MEHAKRALSLLAALLLLLTPAQLVTMTDAQRAALEARIANTGGASNGTLSGIADTPLGVDNGKAPGGTALGGTTVPKK